MRMSGRGSGVEEASLMSRGLESQLDMTSRKEYVIGSVPDWPLVGGYADRRCERAG